MELTRHASLRTQQRGIPPMVIELLLDYGSERSAGEGTTSFFFDKAARRRIKSYVGGLMAAVSKYLNCYAIVCKDGKIITVAYRNN